MLKQIHWFSQQKCCMLLLSFSTGKVHIVNLNVFFNINQFFNISTKLKLWWIDNFSLSIVLWTAFVTWTNQARALLTLEEQLKHLRRSNLKTWAPTARQYAMHTRHYRYPLNPAACHAQAQLRSWRWWEHGFEAMYQSGSPPGLKCWQPGRVLARLPETSPAAGLLSSTSSPQWQSGQKVAQQRALTRCPGMDAPSAPVVVALMCVGHALLLLLLLGIVSCLFSHMTWFPRKHLREQFPAGVSSLWGPLSNDHCADRHILYAC